MMIDDDDYLEQEHGVILPISGTTKCMSCDSVSRGNVGHSPVWNLTRLAPEFPRHIWPMQFYAVKDEQVSENLAETSSWVE